MNIYFEFFNIITNFWKYWEIFVNRRMYINGRIKNRIYIIICWTNIFFLNKEMLNFKEQTAAVVLIWQRELLSYKVRQYTSTNDVRQYTSTNDVRQYTSTNDVRQYTSKNDVRQYTSTNDVRQYTSTNDVRQYTSTNMWTHWTTIIMKSLK